MDTLLRINDCNQNGFCLVDDITPGRSGQYWMGYNPAGRIAKEVYEKVCSNGPGTLLIADQIVLNGNVLLPTYVTVIKRPGEKKRVIPSSLSRLDVFHKASPQAQRIKIQTPWEFLQAHNSGGGFTLIASGLKPEAVSVLSIDHITAAMARVFETLKSDSYTPKLVMRNPRTNSYFEIYAVRDKGGRLGLAESIDNIRESVPVADFCRGGGGDCIPGISIRLSHLSTKKWVDKMLSSVTPGKSGAIIERFFAGMNTSLGTALFGPGVITTQVRDGYEFAENYRQFGQSIDIMGISPC